MYKRLLFLLIGFLSITLTYSLFDTSEAASTVTCSTNSYYQYRTSDYSSWENSTRYNESYTTPSGPYLNSHAHDRGLNSSDFSSTYTYSYYTKTYRQDYSYSVYYSYYECSNGSRTYVGSSTGNYSYGSTYHWYNNYYSPTYNASISVWKTGGSTTSGYEQFSARATGGGGKTSTTTGHRSYYVNKVDVTVSDSKTYEDENFPTVSCTKYYGYGVGDNHPYDCKSSLVLEDSGSQTTRTFCYKYTERGHTDKECSTRVYVKNVAITGPTKTYTGKHHTFRCLATFYDGTTKYVDTMDKVMSSSPYNYIGSSWYDTGWKEPDGTIHKPTSRNDFYPADNMSRTYTIHCGYYPNEYGNKSGYKISDTVSEKTDTHTVNHIGIKQINIDSSGFFPIGPNEYKKIENVAKTKDIQGHFKDVKYITGHWYDFKATLVYNDNTTRDITSAPEVFWTSYPWFDGVSAYSKKNSYDTNMTQSGLGHRIPVDGRNTIIAEYFNRNVPYGGNSSSTYSNSYKSRNYMTLDSKQIKKLEIKDGSGYSVAPKTTVNVDDLVQYSAWITWTDGTREDWTNAVNWAGDYLLENGKYKFHFAGNNNKTSVTAIFNDLDRVELANISDWDSNYDKIEVTIKYDCSQAETLTWGCAIPTGNWQTEPYDYFEERNINFLPPPTAFGYQGNSWRNADGNYRDEYPYNFDFKFNVSGVSEGNGRN